ncbi:hypothetical protein Pmani_013352 [Petrolisthes manimaculis]|uniref:Chitinase n=1 Tax=Petrolisthes manimaculis TaxID=1843537 RepID=A0AAE1PV50_9EUCA|nr:hypothetical protein Pmani_013352 [Petrolisthes manimaculis]
MVCYYDSLADYRPAKGRYNVQDIPVEQCTHLIYAFALLDSKTLTIKSGDPSLDTNAGNFGRNNYGAFVNLKSRNPQAKELRAAFEPLGLLLTASVAADKDVIDRGYDVVGVSEAMHQLHILAYNRYEPTRVSNHASLFSTPDSNPQFSVDFMVQYWMEKGAPADKMVLGVPLYGRSWTLSGSDISVGAEASGPGSPGPLMAVEGSLSYQEICLAERKDGWTKVTAADGPHLTNGSQWVGYDDVESVTRKAQYVRDKGLGGIMVWDVTMDDFLDSCGQGVNPLISAAVQTLCQGTGNDSPHDPTSSTLTPSTPLPATPAPSSSIPPTTPTPSTPPPTTSTPPTTPSTPPQTTPTPSTPPSTPSSIIPPSTPPPTTPTQSTPPSTPSTPPPTTPSPSTPPPTTPTQSTPPSTPSTPTPTAPSSSTPPPTTPTPSTPPPTTPTPSTPPSTPSSIIPPSTPPPTTPTQSTPLSTPSTPTPTAPSSSTPPPTTPSPSTPPPSSSTPPPTTPSPSTPPPTTPTQSTPPSTPSTPPPTTPTQSTPPSTPSTPPPTTPSPSTPPPSPSTPLPTSTSTTNTTSNSQMDALECQQTGYTSDPASCGHFYRCVGDQPIQFMCPPGLHWRQEVLTCDWPYPGRVCKK